MAKARILIVDDSLLVRTLLRRLFQSQPDMEVIGEAVDPIEARALLHLKPDVITLDVEMPRMDGITFLQKLMKLHPLPVIMISTLTEEGAETTFKALEYGAFDFVAKPKMATSAGLANGDEILGKVRAAYAARHHYQSNKDIPDPVVTILSGTGGINALRDVLTTLGAESPPVVAVQKMTEGFIRPFAARLNEQCKVVVKEARDGDELQKGHVYLVPNDKQPQLEQRGKSYHLRLNYITGNMYGTSMDTWMVSCSSVVGKRLTAVALTSAGNDGARGLQRAKLSGATVWAQDPATSRVPDLINAAIQADAVNKLGSLPEIAEWLSFIGSDNPPS